MRWGIGTYLSDRLSNPSARARGKASRDPHAPFPFSASGTSTTPSRPNPGSAPAWAPLTTIPSRSHDSDP
eukprot:118463-Rhodomonas_salina.3